MKKNHASLSYRFCLRQSQSPTYYNLCRYLQEQSWKETHFNWLSVFNENNFKFDLIAAQCLEFKDSLAKLITQYCPQIMPITFCINDENWQTVLSHVADKFYMQDFKLLDHVENLAWILKPAKLNNGKHIKIFQRLSQLEEHYLNCNRLGGDHVLQRYVANPHLLKGPSEGHKYSIRMFVVITNYAGAHLYPEGYFNIALNPYKNNEFTNLNSHLTNEHLKEDELNVVQVPTQQYELFKPFYPQIESIVTDSINGLKKLYPKAFTCEKERLLAIFGFDFIVDENEKVWLLEANHGPCFPTSDEHPLQKKFYYHFWQAFIASFVLPIASKQPFEQIKYQLFRPV